MTDLDDLIARRRAVDGDSAYVATHVTASCREAAAALASLRDEVARDAAAIVAAWADNLAREHPNEKIGLLYLRKAQEGILSSAGRSAVLTDQ